MAALGLRLVAEVDDALPPAFAEAERLTDEFRSELIEAQLARDRQRSSPPKLRGVVVAPGWITRAWVWIFVRIR